MAAARHSIGFKIEQAQQQVRELLTSGALYTSVTILSQLPMLPESWAVALPPTLNEHCDKCDQQTTWKRTEPQPKEHASYTCVSCSLHTRLFYLRFDPVQTAELQVFPGLLANAQSVAWVEVRISKIGQWPQWMAPVSKRLRSALGPDGTRHFQAGASSLRAGRGIGAVAYFRRIVEDHVDDLIAVLIDGATREGNDIAVQALSKAKDSFQATQRLEIAKQYTPAFLRQGGVNPIAVLYELLSEALHGMNEQESIVAAERAQRALVYFFESWATFKESSDQFVHEMSKLATKS